MTLSPCKPAESFDILSLDLSRPVSMSFVSPPSRPPRPPRPLPDLLCCSAARARTARTAADAATSHAAVDYSQSWPQYAPPLFAARPSQERFAWVGPGLGVQD